jgi:hypothetical protein
MTRLSETDSRLFLPFTVEQIVHLFDLNAQTRRAERNDKTNRIFPLLGKDRKAVRKCQERGYKFPKITSWIRATKNDFKLVK